MARGKSVQPATRRERRAAQRAERAAQRPARRTAGSRPLLGSPMALVTVAALVIGVIIIGFAVLNRPPSGESAELRPPVAEVPASLADGRSLGAADAPVIVDIWADFQCPGCAALANRVEPPLIVQFVEKGLARFVYHDAAFQGRSQSYDESVEAAAAARCAAEQGRFWQMHDWLFANSAERQGAFVPDRLAAMAEAAHLDVAAYEACMATGEQQAAVRQETNQAVADGINQTPTLFINGTLYTGSLSGAAIGDAIAEAAAGATPAPVPTF